MSIEVIAGIVAAAFLGWAWNVARQAANACNERARRRAETGEPVGPVKSWDGSAEQDFLHNSGWTDSPPLY